MPKDPDLLPESLRKTLPDSIVRLGTGRFEAWLQRKRVKRRLKALIDGDPALRVAEALDQATARRDDEAVMYALMLGWTFGYEAVDPRTLSTLAVAPWHRNHEEVVSVVEETRPPEVVDAVYELTLLTLPYREWDDYGALGRKCAHALRKIGTLHAVERLVDLTNHEHEFVASKALKQLGRLRDEGVTKDVRRAARAAIEAAKGDPLQASRWRDMARELGID